MSLSNDPTKGMITPYLPQHPETRRVDDFSFRFGEGESLKGIWSVIRKRKKSIWGAGLAGLLLALVVCALMSRQYLGVATIEVQKTDAAETSLRGNSDPLPSTMDAVKGDIATHMIVLQSPNVLLAAVRDLHLDNEPPFKFSPSLMGYVNGSNARIEDEMKRGLPLEQAPYTRDRILGIFAKKLKVENTPDTRLITVEYLNPDPNRAAQIANAIVQEYVTYEARSEATSDAQRWLSDQLNELKNNYQNSQDKLASFEQQSGLNGMVLGALGETGASGGTTHVPALDSLDSLNQQFVAAETDRIGKEAIYKLTQTKDPEAVASLAANDAGVSNAAAESAVGGAGLELLRSFRQQQAALRVTYNDMLTKYGPNNQHLIETKSQLDTVNAQISEEIGRINERARQQYLFAAQREDGLRAAVNQAQKQAGNLNVSAVKLQSLTQEATASRQLYDSLYGKLKELNIQAGLRATNISIADPARPPSAPKRPNPPLYLALGLIAGLFTGVTSAFVREHMDDTVTVALQLQSGANLPMLGNIPTSPGVRSLPSSGSNLESSPLINDPRSAGAESFRSLRTAIQVASQSGRLRTLLVTSPLFGEGKSTVAYNTAVAFALSGKRVLLLDADMRKPHLHDFFDRPCSPGLSDVLIGKAKAATCIYAHRTLPTLSLLPAGSETIASAELLESTEFDQLLSTLTGEYDLIIADSPPILLLTDARVLSEKFGATIAVVRARQTTRTVLKSLSNVLEMSGSRAVGIVLNGVDTNSIDYFDAYGHHGNGDYLDA
ncbi:polysaccharide biosynthesis tyrosine autokinase [Telmatobacter sp. DSM 110680]|uniref:non-specific protein-tyrosine kinase n=1 Tax=Telmatobacter sp. DSM 110680 TaxID=3036704 RepID=A0AAU7DDR8_9BACT